FEFPADQAPFFCAGNSVGEADGFQPACCLWQKGSRGRTGWLLPLWCLPELFSRRCFGSGFLGPALESHLPGSGSGQDLVLPRWYQGGHPGSSLRRKGTNHPLLPVVGGFVILKVDGSLPFSAVKLPRKSLSPVIQI
uniref:Uncharacterized protein n=1 Tax=Naja naja TaxID=35670 RepID=A0A8C6XRV4_NAJNA